MARQADPAWTTPQSPFRIAGDLYYVGSRDLAAFLVTTPAGNILINANLESSPPLIRESIEALGFRWRDTKILLNSQAHYDHLAGAAAILKQTGAKLMVMDGDVSVAESGGADDFARLPRFPPVHVDRILHDGDVIELGGIKLIAHKTPGHTRGCTTFTMQVSDGGRTRNVVIVGGLSALDSYRLVATPGHATSYPGIAADVEHTFALLRALPCDIFLGAHGDYFGMQQKLARRHDQSAAVWIDPAGYQHAVAEAQRRFEDRLRAQRSKLPANRSGPLISQATDEAAPQSSLSAYRYTAHVAVDLTKMPFSSYGSYMAVSAFPNGVYVRELHNNSGQGALTANALHIELLANGASLSFTEHASPTLMQLVSTAGTVDICFAAPNLIRLRTRGITIRLTSQTGGNYAIPVTQGEWELHGRSNYRLGAIKGTVQVTQHWNGKTAAPILAEFHPDRAGNADAFIGGYVQSWQDPAALRRNFDDAANEAAAAYERWLRKMPSVAPEFGPMAEQAAYLTWSSTVAPGGFLRRPAIMMSKNWMAGVWSWDNCFNAMALITNNPETAWNQFMLPFDNQDASGQLPDVMNDETESWRHTKPPVHGWVLRWMMSHSASIDRKKQSEIYQPLCRWTDWFFRNRDADGDGLPEYNQGDDSGWDNTTIFLDPPPLETPDLAALLVVQMDVLSEIAAKLDHQPDARMWRKRSDALLKLMIETYWRGGQFVALHAFDHKATPATSLILYLPLILGQRLPEPIRRQLIERLMEDGRFVTQHGFATEELSSPYYRPNGYWRGPIWAPTMMILAQGLEDAGRADLARDMRLRFCRMVAAAGFAENFDAVTGAGSVLPDLNKPDHDGRDPAYTWTSSVFLIFAHQLPSETSPRAGK